MGPTKADYTVVRHVTCNIRKDSDVMDGGAFELAYYLLARDESASLMSHFDEGTMHEKDIETWFCF